MFAKLCYRFSLLCGCFSDSSEILTRLTSIEKEVNRIKITLLKIPTTALNTSPNISSNIPPNIPFNTSLNTSLEKELKEWDNLRQSINYSLIAFKSDSKSLENIFITIHEKCIDPRAFLFIFSDSLIKALKTGDLLLLEKIFSHPEVLNSINQAFQDYEAIGWVRKRFPEKCFPSKTDILLFLLGNHSSLKVLEKDFLSQDMRIIFLKSLIRKKFLSAGETLKKALDFQSKDFFPLLTELNGIDELLRSLEAEDRENYHTLMIKYLPYEKLPVLRENKSSDCEFSDQEDLEKESSNYEDPKNRDPENRDSDRNDSDWEDMSQELE